MIDPGDAIDAQYPAAKTGPSQPRGCSRGCLLAALVGFAFIPVVFFGLGVPDTYWYRIGPWTIFEGTDGVVVFAEVDLVTLRPGLIRSPSTVWWPVCWFRIDLARDRKVRRRRLVLPADTTFNRNISRIVRLTDEFYLFTDSRLLRLDGGLPEPLRGQQVGLDATDLKDLDAVTARNGWRLLNDEGFFLSDGDPVESRSTGVRVVFRKKDGSQSIAAEPTNAGHRRAVPLLEVNSTKWTSYRRPAEAWHVNR